MPVLFVIAAVAGGVYASMTVLGSMPYNPTPTPHPSGYEPSFADSSASATDWSAVTPGPSPTPFPTPKVTASLPAVPPHVIAMTLSRGQKGIWSAALKYPRFDPGSTPFSAQYNDDFKSETADRIDRFGNGPAAVKTPGQTNTLTGGFDIELITTKLASFTLFWTDSTFKTAENPALEQIETVNYDLGTGQRIGFPDIFSNENSALSIISLRSRDLLQDKLGASYDAATVNAGTAIDFDDGTGTGGTVRDGRNFTIWVITRAGLKITFLEGEVAPVAAGKQTIVVPWTELAGALNPTFPVAALAH